MTSTTRRAVVATSLAVLTYPVLSFGGLFSSPPGVEVLRIDFKEEKGKCDHHVTGEKTKPNKRLKRSDRDVVVWRLTNECKKDLKVTIAPPAGYPLVCAGDPENAKIGYEFKLEASSDQLKKVRAYIVCTVKWPAKTTTYTFVLSEKVANVTVEASEPTAHEISIEVVP